MGVAYPGGSESTIHGLRECIESHWNDEDFVTLKMDFQKAFNMVSCQALLDECHSHFPQANALGFMVLRTATQGFFTPWEPYPLRQVSSKGTLDWGSLLLLSPAEAGSHYSYR